MEKQKLKRKPSKFGNVKTVIKGYLMPFSDWKEIDFKIKEIINQYAKRS